jgi:hypothetical protein
MKDYIRGVLLYDIGDTISVSNILFKESEELSVLWIGGFSEIVDILPLSGREVVDTNNTLSLAKEGLNQVRADESCSPCNEPATLRR